MPTERIGGLLEFAALHPGATCAVCLSGFCPAHGTGVVEFYCHGELVEAHRIDGEWRCTCCGRPVPWIVW